MISKIKSRKIANVKILIGFVLAASLVAVFACEQKKSEKVETIPVEKTSTIVFQGNSLQVSGDSAVIENLKSLINKEEGMKNSPPPPAPPAGSVQEEVFLVVEQTPEFPGGEDAFHTYLINQVKYPAEAVKKGIQGKVFVTFVVGKDGTVKNSKIVRGVDPTLDKEALRVVNAMPKWKPGRQNGKDVAVQFTVPINFKLQ
jgi:TonB family protein